MPAVIGDEALIATGRLPQRLSLITLGVADVALARAFYERLGFMPSAFDSSDVCFFDMHGTILGLYGRKPLAEDATVDPDGDGFRAVSCALNLESEKAVDGALKLAHNAGARIVKHPQHVFWGGYSGYFADPDGHLWEVAYNPFFSLDSAGQMQLPPPNSSP